MGNGKTTLWLFLALVCGSVATAETCWDPKRLASKWDLWAKGTCLRGANLWQKIIVPNADGDELGTEVVGPTYDQANLNSLTALGANYANLSFPGLRNEEAPYAWREDVAQYLDRLVDRARKADLFVVVSFRTGPGRSESGFDGSAGADHSVWQDANKQAAWVEMWRQTALRYRNHANVVGYDLMVEPNANDVLLKIWEPEPFFKKYTNTTYDWNAFAAKIIQAIRSVDQETPILVGGMNYSSLDWLPALDRMADSRVVYAVHNYEPYNYTHQTARGKKSYPGRFSPDGAGTTNVNKDWLTQKLSVIGEFQRDRGAPVAVNEFGATRWVKGAELYFRDSSDIFEGHGVNHALWLWETSLKISWNEFNFRYGPKAKGTSNVPTSTLLEAIKTNWKRNRVRPSNVRW